MCARQHRQVLPGTRFLCRGGAVSGAPPLYPPTLSEVSAFSVGRCGMTGSEFFRERGVCMISFRGAAVVPVCHRRYDMRALPLVAGVLFLLTGCLPLRPGPTYVEYHPVPVRPAPHPVPPAPRPVIHKPAPAPRPDGRPHAGPSIQRPAPQKGQKDGHPAPGRNEPGPAPRR